MRPMRYVFKPHNRPLPAVGPWIADVSADEPLRRVIDGAGLTDRNGDRLLEHVTDPETMWLASSAQAQEGVVFDLGRVVDLETLQVWNYNEPGYTARGVAQADVSVWTEGGGWKTVVRQATLNEAEGTDLYDEPTVLKLSATPAQKVRLSNLKPFADEGFVGLSAIRFYETATLAACNPQPPSEAELSYAGQVVLTWTPGKEAVAHDVYAGIDGEVLTPLGRIAQSQVNLTGLAGGRTYRWRVDQVRENGVVTAGPEWVFSIEAGRAVAHWPFDQFEDQTAVDALDQWPGTFQGTPTGWAGGGRFGGAIELDGQRDFVVVPAMNLNTDRITMTAWLRAEPQRHPLAGVVFCRTDTTVSGIHLDGNNLRYHWNDLPATYNWDSGLVVPTDGTWAFVALTVTPDEATLYLYNDGELKTARNRIHHPIQPFDGPLMIGRDEGFDDRYYRGRIDDVRIYDYALSDERIALLHDGGDVGDYVAAAATLALAGAELLDVDADLKAVAVAQNRADEAGDTGRRRNVLPVLIIVAVIAAAAVLMRKKSA